MVRLTGMSLSVLTFNNALCKNPKIEEIELISVVYQWSIEECNPVEKR